MPNPAGRSRRRRGKQGPYKVSGVFVQFLGVGGAEPVRSARMHVSKLASSPYHMGMPYSL